MIACALLALAPVAPASINIPAPPPENKKSEKKKDAPPPLPPQAVPVAVQVQNGGTVQVALRVYGRQEQTTKYLIRKEPKFGKIISLEPAEREVWILTYQHTSAMNGQLNLQDRILFAAQNKNGTSAAAEIIFDIVDNPPELDAPASVEFGEIAAGVASTRSITVANKGGGTLEGSVTVDAPWSVEPASYKLGHDQQTTLRLTLAPDTDREYQGRLHFSSDQKTEPSLHAHAFAPFTVEPAALELRGDSKAAARSASFTLTNRTAAELTLQMEANERLHLPAQVVLPPNAVATLQPGLAADDPAGMEGTVRLSTGAIFRIISVHATSTLQPKAAPTPSPTPQAMATPSPASIASYPAMVPPPQVVEPKAEPVLPDMDPGKPDNLPKITGITLVRATSDGIAEFAWDPPKLPVSLGEPAYRMEVRRIFFDEKGKFTRRWMAVPNVQFTKKEDRITGLVTGIPPGISDTAHVVALNASGEPCAVSFPLPFRVPAPLQLFTLRNGLLAGFALLLLFALGLRFKQKRS